MKLDNKYNEVSDQLKESLSCDICRKCYYSIWDTQIILTVFRRGERGGGGGA